MKTDLIYGVEDRPPFKEALFAALQHLLAIFVAIITPPLIIASALKLDVEKTGFRSGGGGTALYSGNKFFLYRSYHSHGISRWITVDFRFLYGCRSD